MQLSQSVKLKQKQSLVMTPQLQQAIKLLQLSNLELSQHLQEQVGRALAHQIKPLPRILGQKPHRHVEGRPTPAFQ